MNTNILYVISIFALILFAVFIYCNRKAIKKFWGDEEDTKDIKLPDENSKPVIRKKEMPIGAPFPEWFVCQIDKFGRPMSAQVPIFSEYGNFSTGIFTIGRHNCDYTITNSLFVSPTHLIIAEDANGFYCVDHNSLNGTTVNNKTVKPKFYLEDGMIAYVADVPILFTKNEPKYGKPTLDVSKHPPT